MSKHKILKQWLIPAIVLFLVFLACVDIDTYPDKPVEQAIAVLFPTPGYQVTGNVKFSKDTDGEVVIDVKMNGLKPGLHGFHIHTYGDMRDPEAKSAGGHFNPNDQPHGSPHDETRHAGDLGNVKADENGVVEASWKDPVLALNGLESVIGRALIVHAGEDDLVSQPAGNAGARVAVGVIGIANPDYE